MTSALDCASLPDGDLARRVASGENGLAAEAELCQRFMRRVRLFGLRHLRDSDAAHDLAQRVLLLTLERLRNGAVREPDRIASFVLGVARTLVREGRRARPPIVPIEGEAADLPAHAPPDADPLARATLARCLQALGERERAVMVLTYYREATASEISAALDMPGGHVRVVRHRAIGRLRECMGLSRPRTRPGEGRS